jgi:hypothetical protein
MEIQVSRSIVSELGELPKRWSDLLFTKTVPDLCEFSRKYIRTKETVYHLLEIAWICNSGFFREYYKELVFDLIEYYEKNDQDMMGIVYYYRAYTLEEMTKKCAEKFNKVMDFNNFLYMLSARPNCRFSARFAGSGILGASRNCFVINRSLNYPVNYNLIKSIFNIKNQPSARHAANTPWVRFSSNVILKDMMMKKSNFTISEFIFASYLDNFVEYCVEILNNIINSSGYKEAKKLPGFHVFGLCCRSFLCLQSSDLHNETIAQLSSYLLQPKKVPIHRQLECVEIMRKITPKKNIPACFLRIIGNMSDQLLVNFGDEDIVLFSQTFETIPMINFFLATRYSGEYFQKFIKFLDMHPKNIPISPSLLQNRFICNAIWMVNDTTMPLGMRRCAFQSLVATPMSIAFMGDSFSVPMPNYVIENIQDRSIPISTEIIGLHAESLNTATYDKLNGIIDLEFDEIRSPYSVDIKVGGEEIASGIGVLKYCLDHAWNIAINGNTDVAPIATIEDDGKVYFCNTESNIQITKQYASLGILTGLAIIRGVRINLEFSTALLHWTLLRPIRPMEEYRNSVIYDYDKKCELYGKEAIAPYLPNNINVRAYVVGLSQVLRTSCISYVIENCMVGTEELSNLVFVKNLTSYRNIEKYVVCTSEKDQEFISWMKSLTETEIGRVVKFVTGRSVPPMPEFGEYKITLIWTNVVVIPTGMNCTNQLIIPKNKTVAESMRYVLEFDTCYGSR